MAIQAAIPLQLEMTGPMYLRSSSWFKEGRNNRLGTIHKGSKGEILAFDTDKRYGVGIHVKITEGKNVGKTGWVYYHNDKSRRRIKLLNKEGQEIETPNNPGDFFQKAKNGPGKANQVAVEEEARAAAKLKADRERDALVNIRRSRPSMKPVTVSDPKLATHIRVKVDSPIAFDLGDNATSVYYDGLKKGVFTIDQDLYMGDDIIPIIINNAEVQSRGDAPKRLWIHKDYTQMFEMFKLEEDFGQSPEACLATVEPETAKIPVSEAVAATNNESYLPACEVLQNGGTDTALLKGCLLDIIKEATRGNRDDQGKLKRYELFRGLFERLHPKERDFLAQVMTAIGESGHLSAYGEQELLSIIKTLENRTAFARKSTGNPKISLLDIALQPLAYSMFNANDGAWRSFFNGETRATWIDRGLDAYVKFPKSNFEPTPDVDDLMFFHANYIEKPKSWAKGRNPHDNFSVNGHFPGGGPLKYEGVKQHVQHMFYTNSEIGRLNNGYGYAFTPHGFRNLSY
jgi:hypothetical protein